MAAGVFVVFVEARSAGPVARARPDATKLCIPTNPTPRRERYHLPFCFSAALKQT